MFEVMVFLVMFHTNYGLLSFIDIIFSMLDAQSGIKSLRNIKKRNHYKKIGNSGGDLPNNLLN